MGTALARGQTAETVLADSLGRDPLELIEALRQAGQRKAKATAEAYRLEQHRKVVLSQVMNELATVHASQKLTEAKLERLARTDPRYIAHINGTAAAMEEKEQAESAYWSLRESLLWCEKAISHLNSLTRMDK